jgi:hypothetical protein
MASVLSKESVIQFIKSYGEIELYSERHYLYGISEKTFDVVKNTIPKSEPMVFYPYRTKLEPAPISRYVSGKILTSFYYRHNTFSTSLDVKADQCDVILLFDFNKSEADKSSMCITFKETADGNSDETDLVIVYTMFKPSLFGDSLSREYQCYIEIDWENEELLCLIKAPIMCRLERKATNEYKNQLRRMHSEAIASITKSLCSGLQINCDNELLAEYDDETEDDL